MLSEQAPKGRRSHWAYRLKEVYLIALLEDFAVDTSGGYLHHICLVNRETGQVFYKGLGYIFIELIKFEKAEGELGSELDRWLYVLKHMSKMEKLPIYLRKPIFEKLFNIAEYSKLTKEEKTMFDASMKRKWDNEAVLDQAVKEGEKRGERHAKLSVVQALIRETDFSNAKIAALVGMKESLVNKIRSEAINGK